MWSENELAGVERSASVTVDALVVEASARSRRTVAEHLEDDAATSEAILEVLKRKASFLATTDRFWRIEHALWSSFTGEEAEAKIRAAILNCFPKQGEQKTLEEVIASFFVCECSKALAFAGSGMQAVFRTCKGYITTMLSGRSPTVERTHDTICSSHYSEPGASDGTARPLFGSEAAKAKLQSLISKNKGDLRDNDLQFLFTFAFLLNMQDRARLAKMKNELLATFNMKEDTCSPETGKMEKLQKTVGDTKSS